MISNLIESNTKNDSDDLTFFDEKSIINDNECSVCGITTNQSSQSCRACKEFFGRPYYNLEDKKELKQFSPKCLIQPCNIINLFIN